MSEQTSKKVADSEGESGGESDDFGERCMVLGTHDTNVSKN
jgi:hypothetical protein